MEREQEREGERPSERDEQGEKAKAKWRPRERDCPRLRPKEEEQVLETHCQPRPPKGGYRLWETEGFEPVRLERVSKKYERWWTDTLKRSVRFFQNVLRKVLFERTVKEENAWRKNKSLNWLEFFIQEEIIISFQKWFYLSHCFKKRKTNLSRSEMAGGFEEKKKLKKVFFRCGIIALL